MMNYTESRKQQLQIEIQGLKNKLATIPHKKQKYRKDIERQIKEAEYNLHLGKF